MTTAVPESVSRRDDEQKFLHDGEKCRKWLHFLQCNWWNHAGGHCRGSARRAEKQHGPLAHPFSFSNQRTGWLWLSQGRQSDKEEHEPFVQTPSAQRVKKKRKVVSREQRGGKQQVLAAPRCVFHPARSNSAERCATLHTSKPCLLSPSVNAHRQGGGGAGGGGALIDEETQEYKAGIREAPLEEPFGTRSLALWPCHEMITTIKF